MARPREFDAQEALERAMEVFWAKGYEATSLADLIAAMGISKSSFYDTFGSKHELFLAALDHYNETVASCHMRALMERSESARAGIAAVFDHQVALMTGNGERRGCFVANCAVEMAAHDPAAADRVCTGLARMEEAFLEAVARGQAAGEIPAGRDGRALARYLTSSLNGLIVMAKARPERTALQDIARIVLSALD